MKKLTPKQKKELEYLKDRSIFMIGYLAANENNNLQEISLEFKKVIEEGYKKNNLTVFRYLSKDMNIWIKGLLSKKDAQELDKLLANKFGKNLSRDQVSIDTIGKLIKKGKVSNEEEYRVIDNYLRDISEKDVFFDKQSELERLLKNYIKQEMKSEQKSIV